MFSRINPGSVFDSIKGKASWLRGYWSSIFVRRVSLTFATRVAMLVIGFGSGVIIARYLGPEGRGICAVVMAIAAIGMQFGTFGLHASNTYFIARDKSLLTKIIGNTLWLSLVGGAIISLIILAILHFNKHLITGIPISLVVIALLIIPFGLLSMLGQNILLGLQRIKALNGFEFAQALVGLLAVTVLLVLLGLGVLSVIVLSTVLSFLLSLVIFRYLRGIEKSRLAFDMSLFKQMARYGLKAYLAASFSFLVIRFDMLMVNYFLGAGDAGVYSITANAADILYMLPMSIGMILFPQVAGMEQGGWEFTKRVAVGTAGIMVVICAVVALIARPFITFFYGEPFAGAADALLWLLPGIFALSIQTIFMNYFVAIGLPLYAVFYHFAGFISNVILNIFLIPNYGINGATLASTLSYSLIFLASGYFFIRNRGKDRDGN